MGEGFVLFPSPHPPPHEHHYLETPFSQTLRGCGGTGMELLGGSVSVSGGAGRGRWRTMAGCSRLPTSSTPSKAKAGP